jgi:hypothetical protein
MIIWLAVVIAVAFAIGGVSIVGLILWMCWGSESEPQPQWYRFTLVRRVNGVESSLEQWVQTPTPFVTANVLRRRFPGFDVKGFEVSETKVNYELNE